MGNFSIKAISAIILVAVLLFSSFLGIAHQDAQEVLVSQSPFGTLTVYNTPGWHFTPFAKNTYYTKRSSYEFKSPIRFNDGGKATVIGSIQYEIPLDGKVLIDLHAKYGSAGQLKAQLVETVIDKAIFMSGPLMSSRESYAEKKAELVNDVEDQISNGIFQTRQEDAEIIDPITSAKKTITLVKPVLDKSGVALRQEAAILTPFGVRTFNFTVREVDYDKVIEQQIAAQQQITMDVQTAVANSKKAEQNVLTVTKQGEANAAEAKWKQEVLKAQAVTEAQQQLEVAKLMTQKADQEKQAIILKAEGESEYKRKIITADGALQQKLAAYVDTQKAWATAFSNYKGNVTPTMVFGNGSNGSSNAGSNNATQDFMQLITAKAAKDLTLDMSVSTGQAAK